MPWIQKQLGSACMCAPKKGKRTGFLEKLAEENENTIENDSDEAENDESGDDEAVEYAYDEEEEKKK